MERHEETQTTPLQKMQDMCMTQHSNSETSKRTLLSTTTTHGIHCYGPSKKILTDNGKEFKNKMWDEVFK